MKAREGIIFRVGETWACLNVDEKESVVSEAAGEKRLATAEYPTVETESLGTDLGNEQSLQL